MTDAYPPWHEVHEVACEEGQTHYLDPETGYRVFTEIGLRARGQCCGCGCRHCPWRGAETKPVRPSTTGRAPRWLTPAPTDLDPLTVVFWSGGKDSFLATRAALKENTHASLVLLTSFGQTTQMVAHQELPIQNIVAQAEALELPLVGVPLTPKADYTQAIVEALRFVAAEHTIEALVFGDLHLEYIRAWREKQFEVIADALGCELKFPLWQRDYRHLEADLDASGAQARVCASPDFARISPVVRGDRFGRALIEKLPLGIDAFGENGEFHTEVLSESLTPHHLR